MSEKERAIQALRMLVASGDGVHGEPDDRYFFEKSTIPDRKVRQRIVIERLVLRRTALALLAAGYLLRLDDGEEYCTAMTDDVQVIMRACMSTDEDRLYVYQKPDKPIGIVYLIYGNTGWDVINDHSTSLEEVLVPIDKLTTLLQEVV